SRRRLSSWEHLGGASARVSGTKRLSSNGRPAPLMPIFDFPGRVCASLAVVVRLVVGFQGLSQNPLLTHRQLDSDYYVRWARGIASGDLLSASPPAGGAAFILNPLYAYVLAPIVRVFAEPAAAV